MDYMNKGVIALVSIISAALGTLISWVTLAIKIRRERARDSEGRGVLASDIGYIKAGIDDLKRENRETRKELCELAERVTRCEESVKQAHKRIDEMHEH